MGYAESLLEVRMKKRRYCAKCGGSGKVHIGNGVTRLCDYVAGLVERAYRRTLRFKKGAGRVSR